MKLINDYERWKQYWYSVLYGASQETRIRILQKESVEK